MVNMAMLLLCMIAAYLIGNLSPAILLGKNFGVDIKKEGSGNAGTTNVLRILGKRAALITLIIDIVKGIGAVFMAKGVIIMIPELSHNFPELCAIAVVCGHVWPCFYQFKGGKGVATSFGVLVALSPRLGFMALLIVAIVVILTRYVSLGSICGAIAAPILAGIYLPESKIYVAVIAVIVIYKHIGNMQRLLRGEESKLSFKSKAKKTER